MNRKILVVRPFDDNPANEYLRWVLAEYQGQYVTWLHNSESGSFTEGNYFSNDELDKAIQNFQGRH